MQSTPWTRVFARLPLLLVLLAALLACKKQKTYPDGEQGLLELATALSQADGDDAKKLGESLALPKPEQWFTTTFGPELGARLATDYAEEAAKLSTLHLWFVAQKVKNRTALQAIKVDAASDSVNVFQIKALEAMKAPTALYTIVATVPGEDGGGTIWSFAHVDGTFRYVGKLKAVNPSPGPLDEFRKGEVVKALKEKAGE